MKTRKLYQFFAVALALAFAGCSHEDLAGENPGTGDNGSNEVYLKVAAQLPVGIGTRSTTNDNGGSNDGTEIGKDYENEVKSVLLVLADKDNKFIGYTEKVEYLQTDANGEVNAIQSISRTALSSYYGEDNTLTAEEQSIHVFVFCNPIDALKEIFKNTAPQDDTWHSKVCSIEEKTNGESDNAAIWGGPNHNEGGFLMSSYEMVTKKIPAILSDWDKFNEVENPFQLSAMNTGLSGSGMSGGTIDNRGAVKVERSVARFDFRDGSGKNNTYDVIKEDGKTIVQVQLQKMALVNMSKNFYYLRRVSADGLNDGSEIGKPETSSNFVVDTDAEEKNSGSIIAGNTYADHFNFCLGHTQNGKWEINENAREQWLTYKIADVLKGTDDNDVSWNEGTGTKGDYKIWRYATENTIPADPAKQTNGISTGIVFKAQMIATDVQSESSLHNALTSATGNGATDPILYVYGNEIFVSWTEVRAKAIEEGRGSSLFKAAFGNPTNDPVAGTSETPGVYSDDNESADHKWNIWHNNKHMADETSLKAFKAAATGNEFTLYQSSIDEGVPGYYCYYFYWNRHNDNGNNGIMGKMEFAVVRNNVYKLAVLNIKKLGHPRVTENDPDPVTPETPDEKDEVYLDVKVEVLPWVVRINNIEF
ncbi:Mfa1 family fimbria major subunit [uncultured Bacteroides sp.]|uniref:Mfa1 family fimbria major subunit n=1 Tax=uncultured Bacteroides sp. TaxID=162156 RepID=UPI002618D276|nr:Mfa1 family fimbria major subunit [uncultured Bacteroides sp.]